MNLTVAQVERLTGLDKETIRMYRQKGLLKPRQAENGYFFYSEVDIALLFHIRGLRGSGMSLTDINRLINSQSAADPLNFYDERIAQVEGQIRELQNQLAGLQTRRRSIIDSTRELGKVERKIYPYTKIDIFPFAVGDDPEKKEILHQWVLEYQYFILSLHIPREELVEEGRALPYHSAITIGSYLDRTNLRTAPTGPTFQQKIVPGGECLSLVLRTTSPAQLTPADLAPLLQAAKEQGLRFISDLTGFLCKGEYDPQTNQPVFYYRVRARVAPIDQNVRQPHIREITP